jgi:LysR family transcriptional regulator for bpeEF and oprC
MDRLVSMRMFARVAETGSFSSVAREMGTTQPTVSKQVAALEKTLGAKLLHRSTRRLSLTEDGSDYYERCVRILNEVEEAEANVGQMQARPTGRLRVNIPVAFGRLHVVPRIWGFMRAYPGIEVELILNDRFVDLVVEGVDLAIRVGPATDATVRARRLGGTPQVTIGTPAYFEKHGEPETPADLARHNCILYTLSATPHEWHFRGPEGVERVRIKGTFSANYSEAVRDAVKNELGIAVLPTWLLGDDLETGVLRTTLDTYRPNPLEIHAVYPATRYVPSKVRCFVDYFIHAFESGALADHPTGR